MQKHTSEKIPGFAALRVKLTDKEKNNLIIVQGEHSLQLFLYVTRDRDALLPRLTQQNKRIRLKYKKVNQASKNMVPLQ